MRAGNVGSNPTHYHFFWRCMPLFTVSAVDLQTRTIHLIFNNGGYSAITLAPNMFNPSTWIGTEGLVVVADSPEHCVARIENERIPNLYPDPNPAPSEMVISSVDTVNRTVTVTPSHLVPEGQMYLTTASGTSSVHNFTTADNPWGRYSPWDTTPHMNPNWLLSTRRTQEELNRLYSTIIQDSMVYGTAAVKFSWENMTSLEKEIHDINTMGYRE